MNQGGPSGKAIGQQQEQPQLEALQLLWTCHCKEASDTKYYTDQASSHFSSVLAKKIISPQPFYFHLFIHYHHITGHQIIRAVDSVIK